MKQVSEEVERALARIAPAKINGRYALPDVNNRALKEILIFEAFHVVVLICVAHLIKMLGAIM